MKKERVYLKIRKDGVCKTVDFVINSDDTIRYWRYWFKYNGWTVLNWWVK